MSAETKESGRKLRTVGSIVIQTPRTYYTNGQKSPQKSHVSLQIMILPYVRCVNRDMLYTELVASNITQPVIIHRLLASSKIGAKLK